MAAVTARHGAQWLRWSPAPALENTRQWRLIRFESVDAKGNPQGKAIESTTPAGATRRFPSEQRAGWAADELNRAEGR